MGYTIFNKEGDIVAMTSRVDDAIAFLQPSITRYDIIPDEAISLGDFEFRQKFPDGKICQMSIQFGNQYTLSIINDGYGSGLGLYEIAVLNDCDDFIQIPWLNIDGDDVQGYLTAAQVGNAIILLQHLTGEQPVQL